MSAMSTVYRSTLRWRVPHIRVDSRHSPFILSKHALNTVYAYRLEAMAEDGASVSPLALASLSANDTIVATTRAYTTKVCHVQELLTFICFFYLRFTRFPNVFLPLCNTLNLSPGTIAHDVTVATSSRCYLSLRTNLPAHSARSDDLKSDYCRHAFLTHSKYTGFPRPSFAFPLIDANLLSPSRPCV